MREVSVLTLAGVLTTAVSLSFAGAYAQEHGNPHHNHKKGNTDFALFDGTNPANTEAGVVCFARGGRGGEPWDLHIAVSSFGGAGFRVCYRDGDFVNYQVPTGTSFSLTEAAGSNRSNAVIRIIDAGGTSAGGTAGSVSAEGLYGTEVRCISCDEDSDGPSACDRLIRVPETCPAP
jgi:hypothetical protein